MEMTQKLEESEALLNKSMNELSLKEKIIQDQENKIEEKDQEGSSDELISKDKEILAAEEKLKQKKGAYSYLVKRLKGF